MCSTHKVTYNDYSYHGNGDKFSLSLHLLLGSSPRLCTPGAQCSVNTGFWARPFNNALSDRLDSCSRTCRSRSPHLLQPVRVGFAKSCRAKKTPTAAQPNHQLSRSAMGPRWTTDGPQSWPMVPGVPGAEASQNHGQVTPSPRVSPCQAPGSAVQHQVAAV